jgi:hypothetical protein
VSPSGFLARARMLLAHGARPGASAPAAWRKPPWVLPCPSSPLRRLHACHPLPARLIYYITLCTGIVLAYFVAAISPNLDVANAALPT